MSDSRMGAEAAMSVEAPSGDGVDQPRPGREEWERAIVPLASSVDGRQFAFQASLYDLAMQTGGYVVLERDGDRRIGQVLTLRSETASAADLGLAAPLSTARIRLARGEGVILDGDLRPFHDHHARAAAPEEVAAWLDRERPNRSTLTIGDLLLAPGVPATLDAGGFNRHTFMCGQSGSGKTYSLGLVLEQLLVETSLRIIILDPNSDYVRLAETREEVDDATAKAYAGRGRLGGGVAERPRGIPSAAPATHRPGSRRAGRRSRFGSDPGPGGVRRTLRHLGRQREGPSPDQRHRHLDLLRQPRHSPARPAGREPGRVAVVGVEPGSKAGRWWTSYAIRPPGAWWSTWARSAATWSSG